MVKILGNPEGCWKPEGEKPADCIACYYGKCEGSTWRGSQKCWESPCLVPDMDDWNKTHGEGR